MGEVEHPDQGKPHLGEVGQVEHDPADADDHHAKDPAEGLGKAFQVLAQPKFLDQEDESVGQAPGQEVPVCPMP